MLKTPCVGLIGGLGVGAALHYYGRIAGAFRSRNPALDLVMVHAEAERVFEFVSADDRAGLAAYLNGCVQRMHAAGAEFAVIPAFAPHFALAELSAISPVPLLDIFGPLRRELERRNVRRAAVFGTRYVMESALFGMLPEVELVPPTAAEIEAVHAIYVDVVQQGKGTESQRRVLTDLAEEYVRREGVEAILLAGTDFTVLFDRANPSFPHVDCAEVHVRAIIESLRGQDGVAG